MKNSALVLAAVVTMFAAACSAPPSGAPETEESAEATGTNASAASYSPIPSYPGERCVNKLICKYVHTEPPFATCSGSILGTDCEEFCDYHCVYLIEPLPTVNGIGGLPKLP